MGQALELCVQQKAQRSIQGPVHGPSRRGLAQCCRVFLWDSRLERKSALASFLQHLTQLTQCYWAEQTGNGTAVWADALLTPAGELQAKKANAYFKDRYKSEKMPYFQSYYASPLSRCTITANLTFADIQLPAAHPFVPVVKEGFREGMTPQTCNRRSSKVIFL